MAGLLICRKTEGLLSGRCRNTSPKSKCTTIFWRCLGCAALISESQPGIFKNYPITQLPNPWWYINFVSTGEKFERAVAIMARLRAPGGCPWDREQTFDSIKRYTLEETYEVLEAIDNRDWPELTSELGDLLLQVLFYAEMAQEEGRFSIDDVLDALSRKLISRHPHVFG